MSGPVHTYGSTCLRSSHKEDLSKYLSSPTPPIVQAQFFYASSLPIDDPLTPLPAPSSGSSTSQIKSAQPFSGRDNIALEEAWKALREAHRAKSPQNSHDDSPSNSRPPTADENPKNPIRIPTIRPKISISGEGDAASPASSIGIEHGPVSSKRRDISTIDRRTKIAKHSNASSPGALTPAEGGDASSVAGSESNISGSPFIRAPSKSTGSLPRRVPSRSPGRYGESATASQSNIEVDSIRGDSEFGEPPADAKGDVTVAERNDLPKFNIPVGISRLHLVELPKLKMKPIYWSPLHDISQVIRATWFYENTLLPVEPSIANKLEEGYVYMRPWTETWQDELNSCVENGADAEMKIVHKLWQEVSSASSRPDTAQDPKVSNAQLADPVETTFDSVDSLDFDENKAAGSLDDVNGSSQFKNSSAIYVNATQAQILRPSLLPSVSHGRRPLSAIRKGRQIGIPVVRGFDRQQWDRLHPSKQTKYDMRHYLTRPESRNTTAVPGEQICYACAIEQSRPGPSDLVFVIHGIGQKLSERMESFHFTHAINGFRRSINMELNNEEIWPHIRPDLGGIMVLPVNWRSKLNLDDESVEDDDPMANHFGLQDITPNTIPAVRNLISDVMLDIPYYLSHHKEKMTRAVVKEANRIYRLWCKNNPGFHEKGRVHVMAHSLGSVMALDIYSHQPTKLPEIDFANTQVHEDIFEFDTKNLFFCGSPSGLFLLLNKANLLPRRGRNKPGREGEDLQRGVAGEVDTYGCMPVDNLYNVLHTTDPIAYQLNAAVDSELAESLRPALIPGSSTSFLKSFGSVFRWSSSFSQLSSAGLAGGPTRPSTITKLPSTVEMETHDFTREEIAERRMLLLNDNGQVDYYLSGGGGPLNIQYLNMLSAHSSYWILPDFVRFLVVEIARRQDKDGTLPVLQAVKKKGWKVS